MSTYYAPGIFEVTDELFSEIQTVIGELDPSSPCRALITTMICVLTFPACNSTSGMILPICPDQCPTLDAIIEECSLESFRNNPDFSAVNELLDTIVCLEPQTYYNIPAQYIATSNNCIQLQISKYVASHIV